MEPLPPAARAREVWFAYRHQEWVLRGVSLEVAHGSLTMVMGPSGAGKTTLLKVLGGLLRPNQGKVEVLGSPLSHPVPKDLRRRIGYIPQQLGLVRSLTALENVLMGTLGRVGGVGPLLGLFPKVEEERARECLELLGIGPKATERVYRMSGGERQRVAIARTLVQQPSIVFADEFLSDLDLPRAAEILELVREVSAREDITFYMNLHELPLVQQYGDHVIVLKEGAVVHQGPAHQWDRLSLEGVLR